MNWKSVTTIRERPRTDARDLSMHSIKKLINQLKEEIAIFEAHRTAKT